MSEWQPIETAPREQDVLVLLYWPSERANPVTGFWDGLSWVSDDDMMRHPVTGPTHWLPIPEPPK